MLTEPTILQLVRKKCSTSTDKCMWKHPNDVLNRLKTRSKTKNEPIVGYGEADRYFAIKYFIHRWLMGKEDRFFVK